MAKSKEVAGVRACSVWQRALSDFVWQVFDDGRIVATGSARSEVAAWAAAEAAEGPLVDFHTYQPDNPAWVTDDAYEPPADRYVEGV